MCLSGLYFLKLVIFYFQKEILIVKRLGYTIFNVSEELKPDTLFMVPNIPEERIPLSTSMSISLTHSLCWNEPILKSVFADFKLGFVQGESSCQLLHDRGRYR